MTALSGFCHSILLGVVFFFFFPYFGTSFFSFPCLPFLVLDSVGPWWSLFVSSYTCPIMRTSSRPNRSSSLRIGGRLVEEFESRRTDGGSGSLIVVVDRAPPKGHPSPLGKGKGKISKIRYHSGSEYLRASMKYANAMGPSRVEPFYEKTFVTCYRPPLNVQVWCPGLLTSYIGQVPKMVCFFEAAFRMVSAFPCTPLSRTTNNTSTFARPNFLPISRVFWSAFWSFLGTMALGFPT